MSDSKDAILVADDVRKTYRMGRVDVPVLKGASLAVSKGEWVAILGASGSGKSTLLHLLGDLDHPDEKDGGTVRFGGRSIASMRATERNAYRNGSTGFVFQFYHLLPELNVVENAMLAGLARFAFKPFGFWLAMVAVGALLGGGLGVLVDSLLEHSTIWLLPTLGAVAGAFGGPPVATELRSLRLRLTAGYASLQTQARQLLSSFGLEDRLAHRPRELSGGERQRVAIARALMNQPVVLLADEPTGNLDEHTGGEILDLIAEQHRKGLTIVMVTHDPKIAERADRVVRLHDGRVEG